MYLFVQVTKKVIHPFNAAPWPWPDKNQWRCFLCSSSGYLGAAMAHWLPKYKRVFRTFKALFQTPITFSAMEKKRSKLKDPLSRIISGLLIPIDVLREHSSDADSWDPRTDGFKSPVPHLFTSNTPPSEEEKLRIQEVLLAARKSEVTALLKLERSKVDDRLRDDLSEKQRFIHDHEQLLSSLRTFPPELLECIFKFCLFDPEEWPPKDRRRPASFSLSHVCRRCNVAPYP
jgi:hypothetical protein